MGILDSIVGGISRNIESSVKNAVSSTASSATRSATDAAAKTATSAIKSATINADEAIKKIMFSRNSSGGYDLSYDGKPLSPLTASDLKMVQNKERKDALPILKSFLRPKHEVFKVDKVATVIAERILDDLKNV